MKKKITLLKVFTTLCLLLVGIGNTWGEGVAPVNTVLWGENFAHFGTKTPSSAGTGTGTTIYDNASIIYTQSSENTKGYNEKLAGGTAPELLLAKNNTTWTISGIKSGNAKKISLTFLSNKTAFSLTCSCPDAYTVSGSQKSWTLTLGDGKTAPETFNITLKNTASKDNARIDDVVLKVTEAGASTKTLSSIAVKTAPTIVSYAVGEFFNPAGLVVTATYDDTSTEDIAYEGNEDKFSFSPALDAALATTDEKVTITYGGKSCDQNITVKNIELTSIVVSGDLSKTEYTEGDDFDFTGLVATGYYSDESNKNITDQVEWSIDPATLTAGQTSVKVIAKVNEISGDKTYDITVAAAPLEVTWDASQQSYVNQQAVTEATFNTIISAEFEGGKYYNTGTAVRVYGGKTFAIHAVDGYKITSIVIGFSTGEDSNAITADCGTYSNGTWTGSAKDVKFTVAGTSGHRRLKTFTVTYAVAGASVATPTITPSAEEDTYWEPITVTLSCATEGASVYYTTDGTEPTKSSSLYKDPISVSATTTIKAIAFKDGLDDSEIATKTFNFGPIFNSLSDLAAADLPSDTKVKVSFENVMITDIYTNSSDKRVGIFLNVKAKNDKDIEIYFNNTNDGKTVPDAWIAGGKVSGTLTCPWTYYKNGDVWELCPDKDSEWTWGELTYTAPTTYNIIIADDIQNGTVEADMETAAEGVEVTLTITPEEGYKLGTLTVRDATEGDVTVTDNKFTMPASDVTVSATFEAIPTHEAKFFVNGVQYGETQNVPEGDEVVFPAEDPADISIRHFVGWTASPMPSASDEAPEFVESATMGIEDLNFYAVFAKKTEGGGNYEKVTTAPADWCGKYLIVYETDKLAFDGSLATLDAVGNTKAVEITDNIIASSEAMDAIAFTVAYKTGSSTIYSLKSASGKYISGTKTTNKASNGVAQADTDADYEISFNGTTIESKSSDKQMQLKYNKSNGQTRFRFYSSGQEDIALYKKQEATYSGYCTDVPVTATITSTGYATFSCDYAIDLDNLPEGLTAYFATTYNENANTIHMEVAKGIVPAKTGLFLSGEASAQYDIPVTTDEATTPENNILKPTGYNDLVAGDYVYYISTADFRPIKNETLSLSAGKAYIPKEEVPAEGSVAIDFGGESTGIKERMDNGQWTNDHTPVFNLQGVRVTTPKRGEVYIKNGKKYMMK